MPWTAALYALLLFLVVTPDRAIAQWDRPRTLENRAIDELYHYYTRQQVPPAHPPKAMSCIGRTVWDCFRGDYLCVEFRSCDRDDYIAKRGPIVALLDSAAVEITRALGLGGDLKWVEGQRVAFRLADRKFEEAAAVARACTASDWWCAALRGYIAHLRGQYEPAEREFRAAVAFMPPEVRCQWTNLERLYEFDDYGKIDDECKALPMTHPAWTLWDPLFSMPGNDRLTEHFARMTAGWLRNDALRAAAPNLIEFRNPFLHAGPWDAWQYATLRRVPEQRGMPTRTTVRGNASTITDYVIRPRHERFGLRLLPSVKLASAPFASRSQDWRISVDNGSDQYIPAYGMIRSFDAIAAWLRRNDNGVIIVRGRAQTPRRVTRWSTVLWDGIEFHNFDVISTNGLLTTIAAVPFGGYVVSVEGLHADSGAVRARLGTMPPALDSMRVSDLILVREDPGPAATPEQVAARMLPVWEWRRADGPVRLYWEYYLPASAAAVNLRLEVLQQTGGLWSAVTSAFGATPQTRSMAWTDELQGTETAHRGRSVAVDVSALPAGEYRLRLTVTTGEAQPITVEREFVLR